MPMDRDDIICRFKSIQPSRRYGVEAPHKPLLVLLSLKKFILDGIRLVPYTEADKCLMELLEEFNQSGSTKNTNEPFWRLKYDEVWEVTNSENIPINSKGGVNKGDLCEYNVSGGFLEEIAQAFQNDETLVVEIIHMMLYKVFPDSKHNKVIQTVGIQSLINNNEL